MDQRSQAETPPALRLNRVEVGYGGAAVLHGVSMTVPAGSAVAVLGPNGAGKTTLMRVAAGFKAPKSGSVLFDGADVTDLSPVERFKLGLCDVPDGRGVFPALTVRENLRLFAPARRQRRTVEAAGDVFPALRSHMNKLAGAMSGGQQQMLALARAYFANPKVILIDEVSLGLAPIVLDEVFEMLATLRDRGSSLLVVEQYVHRALKLADYAYVLNKGRVVFEGTTGEAQSLDLHEHYMHASPGVAPGAQALTTPGVA